MSESDRSVRPRRRGIAHGVWLLVVVTVALWAYLLGRSGWPEWSNASTTMSVEPAADPPVEEIVPDAVTTTAAPMVATTTTITQPTTTPATVDNAVTAAEVAADADLAAEIEAAEHEIAAALERQRAEEEARRRAEEGRRAEEDRVEAQEQVWADQQVDPAVQDQAMQVVLGIVERHTDSWPWIVSALDRGDLMFFERLPEPCEGSAACVLRRGGAVEKVWFTLDVLRLKPDFFNRVGAEGIVLHELAHLYDSPAKDSLRDRFAEHYVGCRVRGEEGDELAEELLADAIAVAVLQLDSLERSGFGRYADPFRGCLRDDDEPPPELIEAIYAALFDCTTLEADDHLGNSMLFFAGALPWSEYAGDGIRRACEAPEPTT